MARQLAHELDVIDRLNFAGYFLIVWDIVQFCEHHGILCQGRAVTQEEIPRTGQWGRAPAHIEGQAGRMYPDPGLVAGARPALDL